MHGTKLGRNLEGCTEKELCYSEKGVVSMLTGFFSVHVSIRQTPKPSVQMAAGSTLPATRHGLLLWKYLLAFSSCACMDGQLCEFQSWQYKTQWCESKWTKFSLGVLGSVQNTYGKMANCSAVWGEVRIWVCLGSHHEQALSDRKVGVYYEFKFSCEGWNGTSVFGQRRSDTASGGHLAGGAWCGCHWDR